MPKISPILGFSLGQIVDRTTGKRLMPSSRDTEGNIIPISGYGSTGKQLLNTLCNEMYEGLSQLTNDQGGYQETIDTLTQIYREVSTQTFYTLGGKKVSDFIPLVIGQGAFSQSLLTFKTGSTSNQFKQAIFRSGTNSSIPKGNTAIKGITQAIFNFAEGLDYSLFEMKQAALFGNFDVIAAKEKSRKAMYDQGLQQAAFVGMPEFGNEFMGLINQNLAAYDEYVPVDTGILLDTPISLMNEVDINNLVGTWILQYYKNTNYTTKPTDLVMPTSDYFGLDKYITPAFPLENSSRRTILEKAFKAQTGNANFMIHESIYNQADQANEFDTGLTKDRYVLYNKNSDSLKMLLPVPYTVTLANTVNGYNWENVAYGQISGVQATRPLELQYFDLP